VFAGKITQGPRGVAYLADIALSNGKHLMVPLRVKVNVGDGCTVQSTCLVMAPGDTMFACADRTGTPSACAGNGMCAGPPCGGGCCTTGEMCINNVCRCGSGLGCGPTGQECARGMVSPGCGAECCSATTQSCTF